MKILTIAATLTALALLVGCDKNDEPDIPSKFVYKGKVYPLTRGYAGISCSTSTIDGLSHSMDVFLFSSDTQFTGHCPSYDYAGSGSGLQFRFMSRSKTEVTVGTYTTQGPNLFATFLEYANADNTGPGTLVSMGLQGSVAVSRSGSEYTIDFSLTVVPAYGGGDITGKFVGVLEEY